MNNYYPKRAHRPLYSSAPPRQRGSRTGADVSLVPLPPSPVPGCCRSASSSTYIRQLEDQQVAIRKRLNDLGVESIRSQLEQATIQDADESMSVDSAPPRQPSPPAEPQLIGAKQRALARWVSSSACWCVV